MTFKEFIFTLAWKVEKYLYHSDLDFSSRQILMATYGVWANRKKMGKTDHMWQTSKFQDLNFEKLKRSSKEPHEANTVLLHLQRALWWYPPHGSLTYWKISLHTILTSYSMSKSILISICIILCIKTTNSPIFCEFMWPQKRHMPVGDVLGFAIEIWSKHQSESVYTIYIYFLNLRPSNTIPVLA